MMSVDMVTISEIKQKIEELGIGDAEVFEAMRFKDGDELVRALFPLRTPTLAFDTKEFVEDLIEKAGERADLARRVADDGLPGSLSDSLWLSRAAKKRRVAEEAKDIRDAEKMQAAKAGGTPSDVVWRPARRGTHVGASVQDEDRRLRDKWGARLALALADTPAAVMAARAADPNAFMAGLIGKARPETLKKRVRTWEALTRWLTWKEGRTWPDGAVDILNYLHHRLAEQCPATFPAALLAAVRWFEVRSGYTPDRCFGRDALLQAGIDHATAVAQEGGAAGRKAPRLPLTVVAALECKVVNDFALVGIRILAWSRLVKVYGTLRADDLRRLRPRDLALRTAGLTGTLVQTKTSGKGRKTRTLPLFVPREAFLAQPHWLEVGYGLWQKVGDPGRDYFIPRLEPDLIGFADAPASSADMASLNKLVLSHLMVPVSAASVPVAPIAAGVPMKEGEARLLNSAMCEGWTGHSERATMPSVLAAMGVPKAERDHLGRWSPSGSDDYVRTHRAVVRDILGRFRRAVSSQSIFDITEEDEAIEEAKAYAGRLMAPGDPLLEDGAQKLARAAASVRRFVTGGATPEGHSPTCEASEAEGLEEKEDVEAWSNLAARIVAGGRPRDEVSRREAGQAVDPAVPAMALELLAKEPVDDYTPQPKFLIAISRDGVRRLHRADGCWHAVEAAFKDFEEIHEDTVQAERYTAYCRRCWPFEGPETVAADESDDPDTSSSDA